MKATKQKGRMFAVLAVGVVLLMAATGAEAAMMNWTETVYTASSDSWTFDYDMNSQYDLTPTEVTVKKDPIFIAPAVTLVGTIYQFTIPNFYDPLPKKTLQITLSGTNSNASGFGLATVLDVLGSDAPFGEIGPSLPAQGQFISGTTSPTLITQLWHILPNPDWESVKIWSPSEFGLDKIKIVTQSVPLPASILLLGSALVGLIFLRRKPRTS